MASAKTYSLKGKAGLAVELPVQFSTPYRPDVIRRAVLALRSQRYQRHGVDELAGKRRSVVSWQTGHGRSRIPRVKGAGTRAANRGGFVAATVGGRRTHPPEARKVILEKISVKEKRLAIRSAIAATASRDLVAARGHKVEKVPELPLVVSDDIESIGTTKAVEQAVSALGLDADVQRSIEGRNVRAGKGKMRGRRVRVPKSFLLVVGQDRGVGAAARNLPGVDIAEVHGLNAELLAPGTHPGRLVVWTKSAIDRLQKEQLFI